MMPAHESVECNAPATRATTILNRMDSLSHLTFRLENLLEIVRGVNTVTSTTKDAQPIAPYNLQHLLDNGAEVLDIKSDEISHKINELELILAS